MNSASVAVTLEYVNALRLDLDTAGPPGAHHRHRLAGCPNTATLPPHWSHLQISHRDDASSAGQAAIRSRAPAARLGRTSATRRRPPSVSTPAGPASGRRA